MATSVDSRLVASPGVCGGRLRIDGTRISVLQVAALFRQGSSAEDLVQAYPHVDPGGIYAALAYYLANADEIDAELAAEVVAYDAMQARASA
jgi:uncharacterized protein (DUF433 family)